MITDRLKVHSKHQFPSYGFLLGDTHIENAILFFYFLSTTGA